jgi:nitrate/nitrite transporter NarK
MINTLGQLGGIVSPVMVGLIRDATGSTSLALHAIGALSLLSAVLLWFGLPEPLRIAGTLAAARLCRRSRKC